MDQDQRQALTDSFLQLSPQLDHRQRIPFAVPQ